MDALPRVRLLFGPPVAERVHADPGNVDTISNCAWHKNLGTTDVLPRVGISIGPPVAQRVHAALADVGTFSTQVHTKTPVPRMFSGRWACHLGDTHRPARTPCPPMSTPWPNLAMDAFSSRSKEFARLDIRRRRQEGRQTWQEVWLITSGTFQDYASVKTRCIS